MQFLSPQNIGNFPYPPGWIYGMFLANDITDAINDIVISPGVCRAIEDDYNIVAKTKLTKRMDSIFSAGDGGGFRDTNNIANNSWFHVHAIYNPTTGANDYVASVSHDRKAEITITIASPGLIKWDDHGLPIGATLVFSTTGALPTGITAGTLYYVIAAGYTANAFQIATSFGGAAINTSGVQSGVHYGRGKPVLPAGFVGYRRVGSIYRNNLNINRLFTQALDDINWVTPVLDVNTTSPGAALREDNFGSSIPFGIITKAIIRTQAGDNNLNIIFPAPGAADAALSQTAAPLYDHGTNAVNTGTRQYVLTTASGTIKWKANVASAPGGIRLSTLGYIDFRGRMG